MIIKPETLDELTKLAEDAKQLAEDIRKLRESIVKGSPIIPFQEEIGTGGL